MKPHHAILTPLLLALLFSGGCASISDKFSRKEAKADARKATPPNAVLSATNMDEKAAPVNQVITSSPALPAQKYTHNVAPAQTDLWFEMRHRFSLPTLNNPRVAYYEKRFTRRPKSFYAMVDRAKWFLPSILKEIKQRNLPTELALLPAVESAFITDAKSHSNASGLWQFIPSTGKLFNLQQNRWYDARQDPVLSTTAALDFLTQLEQRFEGNWFHAIAAYNAGGWTVEKAIRKNAKRGKSTHFNHLTLRRETKDYVPKLIAFRNIILNPHRYGITLPKMENTIRFASLDAGAQTDLDLIAKLSGTPKATVRFLNSAYRRGLTPPNGPHTLHLPVDKIGLVKTRLAKIPKNNRRQWAHHKVKKGEVLGRIAMRYGVSVAAIKRSNKLTSNTIHIGKTLLIPVANARLANATTNKKMAKNNLKTSNKIHKVRKGDTLWDIARRYGINVAQISKWNQISKISTLHLGQRLKLYPSS